MKRVPKVLKWIGISLLGFSAFMLIAVMLGPTPGVGVSFESYFAMMQTAGAAFYLGLAVLLAGWITKKIIQRKEDN